MQFELNVSQIIGWLNEQYQQAVQWPRHHNFSQDVSQLNSAFEQGFEPAHSWLHVIAVFFAFATDVLKPLAPRFTKRAAIGGFTLWVPSFIGMQFHWVPQALGSAFIVFCLSVAVLASLLLIVQRGHEHGALAELVPGVERLQKRLGIIENTLVGIKEATTAVRATQEEIKAIVSQSQEMLAQMLGEVLGPGRREIAPDSRPVPLAAIPDGYGKALTLEYFITLGRLSATAALMQAAHKSETQIDQGMESICGLSKLSENEIDYVWTLLEIPTVLGSVGGSKWPLKTRARVNEHFQLLHRAVCARSNEMKAVWKVTSALGYILWIEAPKQQAEQLLEVLREIDVMPANKNEIVSGLTSSINDERIHAMEVIRVLLFDKIR